jgi:penicillin-binding protein 1A
VRRALGGRRRPAALIGAGLLAVGVSAAVWVSTPTPAGLEQRVAARTARLGGTPVGLDRVSPLLGEAVVATEDERFYHHSGIDALGVLRAIPYDLAHLSLAQGASTITEQLAKLLYLGGSDRSTWRKLEDAALAVKLESRYTKEQILEAYLNSAYFGEGATGIDAASRRFFGVAPARLDLAQASLLAGLIQAPGAYDPRRDPGAARARQVDVLRSLVRNGYVTEEQAAAAGAAPLPIRGALALPPVTGVDYEPGPAFVWRQLGVGALVLALGLAGFVLVRRRRLPLPAARFAAQVALVLVVLIGAATIVRSFRVL